MVARGVDRSALRSGRDGAPDGGRPRGAAAQRHRLKALKIPALVIHGADDPLIPASAGEDTARSIPDAELLVIPGAARRYAGNRSVPVYLKAIGAFLRAVEAQWRPSRERRGPSFEMLPRRPLLRMRISSGAAPLRPAPPSDSLSPPKSRAARPSRGSPNDHQSRAEHLPNVKLTLVTADGPKPVETKDYFAGKTVALFGVPGAFTPTCPRPPAGL